MISRIISKKLRAVLNIFEEAFEIRLSLSNVAIIFSSLLIIIIFALTAETELHWVGHALAGVLSLLFSMATAIVGAMLTGRIRRLQGINLFRLHKKLSIYLAILVLAAFFLGVWARVAYGEPLFWQHTDPLIMVVQGWFGLVVTVAALAQIIPCLTVKDRRKMRRLHMILGYVLVILLVVQMFLGVGAALVEIAGG